MKSIKEIRNILSNCKCVDSHVHTHLCDGKEDMTVKNIAETAKSLGIDGIILTPHFHKQVSDDTLVLYSDTNQDIFLKLREEIDRYERDDGAVKIILSTEADIISLDGEISLNVNKQAEAALDLVTPTMNYHPCLPLAFVGLTMGKKIDELHESGAYETAAAKVGGIGEVLSLMYEAQVNAIKRCEYPSMLGHLFMAHSFHPVKNNAFGAKPEHLELMKDGVKQLLSACKSANALVDLTGVHMTKTQSVADKIIDNGFLVEFQKYVVSECRKMGICAYYGSDAHSLSSIGRTIDYYKALFE